MAVGVLVAAGAGVLWAQAPAASRVRVGDPTPMTTVKMKSVDGSQVSIADVAGEKGTLVVFSCNACPWVKAWEDRIAALGNAYREKGVGVIVINSNDPAAVQEDGFEVMQQRARDKGLKFPYVVDATSEVALAFGATRTPEAFLFGRDGRLVYHGTIDDNAQEPDKVRAHYLRDALQALVAGQPIAQKETKALGCGIKFRARA
jgi:peroxiredoxin